MKKIKFAINIDNKKKKQLLTDIIGVVILIILVTYVYFSFFKPQQEQLPQQNQPQQQTEGEKADAPVHAANTSPMGSANPFVEISQLKNINASQNAANGGTSVAMSGINNSSLPAIPSSVPMPNVGSIPLPTIPNNSGNSSGMVGTPESQQAAPAVQGVFTGKDGKNVAIMNDGSVVSEGDTYNDGRVAYIGGDGVQFDDGHKMEYK